jgi:hypothetical protein
LCAPILNYDLLFSALAFTHRVASHWPAAIAAGWFIAHRSWDQTLVFSPITAGQSRRVEVTALPSLILVIGTFCGSRQESWRKVMDDLKIDLAKIANWVHALMAMLVNPRFSNGAKLNPHSTDRAVHQTSSDSACIHR